MGKRRSKTNSVDKGGDKKRFGTPKNISRIEEENEHSQISSGRIQSAKKNKENKNNNHKMEL